LSQTESDEGEPKAIAGFRSAARALPGPSRKDSPGKGKREPAPSDSDPDEE
jgi:hypothetical protein